MTTPPLLAPAIRSLRVRAWALLLLLVGGCAWAVQYASHWPSDNRPSIWMRAGEVDEPFAALREHFGGDEVVLVRARDFALDDAAALQWLHALGPRLAKLPAVAAVIDPFRLPGAAAAPGDPAATLRSAAERPIVVATGLVTTQPPHADFVLRMRADATQTQCCELAADLRTLADEGARARAPLLAGGHPLIAAALDQEARAVEERFAPLLALASVLATALFFRSLPLAAITVLPAALASAGVRAGLRLCDWPQNLILVSAGPMTFVIVLAATLHIAAVYARRLAEGETPEQAARGACREKLAAGLMSGGTTAIGFLASLTSGVEPVRRLGVATAVAVSLAIVIEYGAVPTLLAAFVRRASARAREHLGGWGHCAALALRARGAVLASACALIALGAWAPSHLQSGTNAVDYFPRGTRVREEFLSLERDGGALTVVELLARHRDGSAWTAKALQHADVETALRRVAAARTILGPELVLRDAQATQGVLAALAAPLVLRAAGRVDADSTWARWSVAITTGDAATTVATAHELAAAAAASTSLQGAEVHATGSILRILEVQTELVDTLWSTLALTLGVTILLFFLVIRSARELLAALLANLLPVAAVLIAPWLLGWPLDAATVMVASVVLGLAYNTFHLLQAAGPPPARWFARAGLDGFRRTARPAGVSYLVLALGFAVLIGSGFTPTSRFGLLTAVGVLFALLGDLFVLPAVWLRVRPRGAR